MYVISFVAIIGYAQAPDTQWTRTYGEGWGYSVQQTTDGGYIIGGRTGVWPDSDDVYIVRTDTIGDSLWTRVYGGADDDECRSIQQTNDSGYVAAGWTESFGAGGSDVWLLKTDDSGDTLWTKTYGGTLNDEGHSVQQTADGGYIYFIEVDGVVTQKVVKVR